MNPETNNCYTCWAPVCPFEYISVQSKVVEHYMSKNGCPYHETKLHHKKTINENEIKEIEQKIREYDKNIKLNTPWWCRGNDWDDGILGIG
jgi:hypothetical protein